MYAGGCAIAFTSIQGSRKHRIDCNRKIRLTGGDVASAE